MLRIIALNVNGLRAGARKGLMPWIESSGADFICLQEIKAQIDDLPPELAQPPGWHAHFHLAQTRGYSGTAVFTRHAPSAVRTGFGNPEFDAEGRYVELAYPGLRLVSVYFPSGSSSPERQLAKFRFLEAFLPHLRALQATGDEVVVCGDVNIAHKEIDLKNWKGNLKNSGFLPEERAWLDGLFGPEQWVDVFRTLDPAPERYTWWSARGRARENNVGWRIDYQFATAGMAARASAAHIYTAHAFSDHAPLIIDYDVAPPWAAPGQASGATAGLPQG
jgi:exodeoxyribonuclease-3